MFLYFFETYRKNTNLPNTKSKSTKIQNVMVIYETLVKMQYKNTKSKSTKIMPFWSEPQKALFYYSKTHIFKKPVYPQKEQKMAP